MEDKEDSVETKIDKFMIESCDTTIEEVRALTIQRKMALINMKSQEKWDEFKMGLRKAGYII